MLYLKCLGLDTCAMYDGCVSQFHWQLQLELPSALCLNYIVQQLCPIALTV